MGGAGRGLEGSESSRGGGGGGPCRDSLLLPLSDEPPGTEGSGLPPFERELGAFKDGGGGGGPCLA